jgi:predicted DsbA family dithiol-disulfide isomerase
MSMVAEVIEFTDPGCPWSWGSDPKLRYLRHRYEGHVSWRRVFGVQMDGEPGADADEPATDVRDGWLEMAKHSDAPIVGWLERAHASTRPAASAAKAAELQGTEVADRTLRRLREAFFIVGRPADTPERIADAVAGVEGLDLEQLLRDSESDSLAAALQADWREARDPDPSVIDLQADGPHPGAAKREGDSIRYVFPTIVVSGSNGRRVVPGWRSVDEYTAAFEAVAPELVAAGATTLTADDALERYRSLSAVDLELLTAVAPPQGAVRIETSTTPLWVHPSELIGRAGIDAREALPAGIASAGR